MNSQNQTSSPMHNPRHVRVLCSSIFITGLMVFLSTTIIPNLSFAGNVPPSPHVHPWDEAITAGTTLIKASHFNEIYNEIDHITINPPLAGGHCGHSGYAWTLFPVSVGDPIRAAYITELRAAIDAVYDDLEHGGGLPGPYARNKSFNWSDDPIQVANTLIRKAHIDELRLAIDEVTCCGDGICQEPPEACGGGGCVGDCGFCPCAGTTINRCTIPGANHLEIVNGTCDACDDGPPPCSYQCNDGSWQLVSNTCRDCIDCCLSPPCVHNNGNADCTINVVVPHNTNRAGSCQWSNGGGTCSADCWDGDLSWNNACNPPDDCNYSVGVCGDLTPCNHGDTNCGNCPECGPCDYDCWDGVASGSQTCTGYPACTIWSYNLTPTSCSDTITVMSGVAAGSVSNEDCTDDEPSCTGEANCTCIGDCGGSYFNSSNCSNNCEAGTCPEQNFPETGQRDCLLPESGIGNNIPGTCQVAGTCDGDCVGGSWQGVNNNCVINCSGGAAFPDPPVPTTCYHDGALNHGQTAGTCEEPTGGGSCEIECVDGTYVLNNNNCLPACGNGCCETALGEDCHNCGTGNGPADDCGPEQGAYGTYCMDLCSGLNCDCPAPCDYASSCGPPGCLCRPECPDPGNPDCTGCFLAGTLVDTPSGRQAIENLSKNSEIYAVDPQTGEKVQALLIRLTVSTSDHYLIIETEEDDIVKTTRHHPFYQPDLQSFTKAGDLKPGDMLIQVDITGQGQESLNTVKVKNVTVVNEPVEVYHPSVDHPLKTFTANGFLVHNKME